MRWFQLLCLTGPWKEAQPKALRWEIFHAPGRLVYRSQPRIVCLLEGWPSAGVRLGAGQGSIHLSQLLLSHNVHDGPAPPPHAPRVVLHARKSRSKTSEVSDNLTTNHETDVSEQKTQFDAKFK